MTDNQVKRVRAATGLFAVLILGGVLLAGPTDTGTRMPNMLTNAYLPMPLSAQVFYWAGVAFFSIGLIGLISVGLFALGHMKMGNSLFD